MINVHRVPIREVQTAGSPSPLLLLQEPGDSRGYVWMASYASAPVDPVAVVGTARALDFHMALDGGVCVAGEACPAVGWLEGPASPIVHSPVCARDPGLLLVRVAGDCPSLPHRVDGVGKGLQDPGTGNVRVGVAPAHHRRVQRLHQRLLSCVLLAVNRLAQCFHLSADRRLAGLDDRCATMPASSAVFPSVRAPRGGLSERTAEEVASRGLRCAYEGGGDARLAWLQAKSPILSPLCGHVLALQDNLAILVQHHTVISIDHDFGCLEASTPTPWALLAHDRFETVQGHVGTQRGTIPSWHRPVCRGEPLASLVQPRLQPSFPLAAAAWARVDRFAYGGMIHPVEAWFDVGVSNVCGFMADAREDGFERLVPGPPWAASLAVGFTAGFPCGFEHTVRERWEGSVVYGGDPQRPHGVGPRLRYPSPTNRCGLVPHGPGMRQRQPLLGRHGRDPINACRLCPLVVLGDPAYGQELGRPGSPHQSLKRAYCADITPT